MSLSVRDLNIQKKTLKCQMCGKFFLTDRCHRTCPKCNKKKNNEKRVAIRTIRMRDLSTLSWERPNIV